VALIFELPAYREPAHVQEVPVVLTLVDSRDGVESPPVTFAYLPSRTRHACTPPINTIPYVLTSLAITLPVEAIRAYDMDARRRRLDPGNGAGDADSGAGPSSAAGRGSARQMARRGGGRSGEPNGLSGTGSTSSGPTEALDVLVADDDESLDEVADAVRRFAITGDMSHILRSYPDALRAMEATGDTYVWRSGGRSCGTHRDAHARVGWLAHATLLHSMPVRCFWPSQHASIARQARF
jgi:hypothetical protein